MHLAIAEFLKTGMEDLKADLGSPSDPLSQFIYERQVGIRPNTRVAKNSANEWNEELVPTQDDVLAKNGVSGSTRRKAQLLSFLKSRLAIGESAESVIQFAQQHDPATANLLREVAAGI